MFYIDHSGNYVDNFEYKKDQSHPLVDRRFPAAGHYIS